MGKKRTKGQVTQGLGEDFVGSGGGDEDSPGKRVKLNRKGKVQKLRPGIEKNISKLDHLKLKKDGEANGGSISDAYQSKFARGLASTDWHTRERALRAFEDWLSSSEEVESEGLRKMWKGLYYCFWHSDKVPVQQELAKRLADLVCSVEQHDVALTFWETFLDTMAREWSSIDRLRLDKFMSLVRMFIHACLKRLCKLEWHPEVVVPMWEVFGANLLKVNEVGSGMATSGLALHMTSVFVDELEQVCAGQTEGEGGGDLGHDLPDTIPSDVLSFLVEPFRILLCTNNSKALLKRVMVSVYAKLTQKCTRCMKEMESNASSEEVKKGYPFVQLDALEMAQELFNVAADASIARNNRDMIYDVIALLEELVDYQKTSGLFFNSTPASPVTPSDSKGSKRSKKSKKKKKKGVVFDMDKNQYFMFRKKDAVEVQRSPSAHRPLKGIIKC
ncbi:nucleolar protein Nop52 [Chloropicon primus]|uniref:Nucleolar protein Nop52 n=2 Tax=Chloropicon primus TaxID=1764295 RepID=A0A5B8MUG4_9CHLO|nr:nucleolar protein Nop52 [Chloropicon primus]UPR02306.1 nucleolar protein Nop52 [Chloropicon primus]|eukprot:QDZ23092.1 nucleolar protein Nop52 [Chloropicon primus]